MENFFLTANGTNGFMLENDDVAFTLNGTAYDIRSMISDSNLNLLPLCPSGVNFTSDSIKKSVLYLFMCFLLIFI